MKLEPEFSDVYNRYITDPSKSNASSLLTQLGPVIDRGISAHVGRQRSPTTRSHARRLALRAVQTYDPLRSQLSTHVLNHLKGLRRVHRQQTHVLSVPERVVLDQRRLAEASAQLEDRLGREPTMQELADLTGMSIKRIRHIQTFRGPRAEGQISERAGVGGELEGFMPATQRLSDAWLNIVYDDLNPINKKIMEWTLGLDGEPVLSNKEIARRLSLSPGAVSQRKKLIQDKLNQEPELSPF